MQSIHSHISHPWWTGFVVPVILALLSTVSPASVRPLLLVVAVIAITMTFRATSFAKQKGRWITISVFLTASSLAYWFYFYGVTYDLEKQRSPDKSQRAAVGINIPTKQEILDKISSDAVRQQQQVYGRTVKLYEDTYHVIDELSIARSTVDHNAAIRDVKAPFVSEDDDAIWESLHSGHYKKDISDVVKRLSDRGFTNEFLRQYVSSPRVVSNSTSLTQIIDELKSILEQYKDAERIALPAVYISGNDNRVTDTVVNGRSGSVVIQGDRIQVKGTRINKNGK